MRGLTLRALAPGLVALLAMSAGCSSMRYKKTEDLWIESDQRFKSQAYSDAIPYYDELLRRDGNDGRARLLRGISRDRTEETGGALEDYSKAEAQSDVRASLFQANLAIKKGFYEQAEASLAKLRDQPLDTHERVAQLTLVGTLRLSQGNARLAAQSLERACDLGRGSADPYTLSHVRTAHVNAAQAYYKLGELERASEHYDQYAKLAEATGVGLDGDDYYMMTVLHYMTGDFETARGYLAKADPEKRARAGEILNDPSFFGRKGEARP